MDAQNMPLLFTTPKLNEGGTEFENVLGCDSTKMSPLPGLGIGMIFLDKLFNGRKVEIVKQKNTPPSRAQNQRRLQRNNNKYANRPHQG